MLTRLTVFNLAIVEKAEVEFASGLNVLTGETGAGKSVLMGALELVLGGRAESSAVREGAKEARVEAVFHFPEVPMAVSAVLEEKGLPACEAGELIVRRVVTATGAGRVWVNDASTTVATLRQLGSQLVDIHGPRANQHILEESFQRATLDAGLSAAVREKYAAAWRAYRACRDEVAALSEEASSDEIDLLRYQVNELKEAALTPDDDDLAARHAAAAHAEEIVSAADEVMEALGGDAGVTDRLARLAPTWAALARHLPDAATWRAEAEELTARADELSRTVADAVSRMEVDPEEFAALDARLGVVNRLQRKYLKGASTEGAATALCELLFEKETRLESLEHRTERLSEAEKALTKAEADLVKAAAALTKARRAAGEKLARAVTDELRDLGFARAAFAVELAASAPEASGADQVIYLFGPNPGEPMRPLAAIASSGEAARVMLALKAVLAERDATDVLVFDEIDANVGGETGRAVGEKMRRAARHHQVLAITHLPQCAVYGSRHLFVSKSVSSGRTRTQIEPIEGEARAHEIARMLGGEGASDVVMRHAEELLARAAAFAD